MTPEPNIIPTHSDPAENDESIIRFNASKSKAARRADHVKLNTPGTCPVSAIFHTDFSPRERCPQMHHQQTPAKP